MVNITIVNYLKNFGNDYNLDDLKKEILAKGYSEFEFLEALEVFRKDGEKQKVVPGTFSPLPTHKFVDEKKDFGWLSLVLILFGILFLAVGVVVLLNFMGMPFFGFNIFEYFGGA